MFKWLFQKPSRTSYADEALGYLLESWESLDATRRLINKIGDGDSVDDIEHIQEQLDNLKENIKARNKGYFTSEQESEGE